MIVLPHYKKVLDLVKRKWVEEDLEINFHDEIIKIPNYKMYFPLKWTATYGGCNYKCIINNNNNIFKNEVLKKEITWK